MELRVLGYFLAVAREQSIIRANQDDSKGTLTAWINKELSELEIVATYNLLFNASLMVEEGLGYAIGLDKIINTAGNNTLSTSFSTNRSRYAHRLEEISGIF